jgi:H+-translocating NAD(P) transhydrogenase subunit alpha
MEQLAHSVDPFVSLFAIFILAVFVGYFVVWSVGALLAVGAGAIASGSIAAMIFGFFALIFASVNIFGGFMVTSRMLAMYKKKEK